MPIKRFYNGYGDEMAEDDQYRMRLVMTATGQHRLDLYDKVTKEWVYFFGYDAYRTFWAYK